MEDHSLYCVLIPYKDGTDKLITCLDALVKHLPPKTIVLLVDDGSTSTQPELDFYINDSRIHLLRHEMSQGPAAARNTGIEWCRIKNIDIVILLDSDCIPGSDFVESHVRLHKEHNDVACIGGGIQGIGQGIWARLDGIASWFTSIPGSRLREVGRLYHIPTTNMSLKLGELPIGGDPFDPSLRTGEDVKFLNRLRLSGGKAIFSPTPIVHHRDRENLRDFLIHQYRWGLHTCAVRFDSKSKTSKRLMLALALIPLLPAYAFVSSLINLIPWLSISKKYLLYWPVLFLLYLYKGVGVVEGTLKPDRALYPVLRQRTQSTDQTTI
jgi:glycosyltransferase involved in cell wall biosynthesis